VATNFPGSLDSYSTKTSGQTIAESHINDPQDAIEAIEAKVGTGSDTAANGEVFKGTGAGTSGWAALVSSEMPAGSVVQVVNTTTGSVETGSTTIPFDDTIPQNTEGDEYMTLAITPTSITNKLKIDVVCNISNDHASTKCVGLFQDSTANALAAVAKSQGGSNWQTSFKFTYYMTAGTTSETTFKVRAGAQDGTTTFNGYNSGRMFGGVMASSITITEIKA
jgi:hypothetical protein